MRQRAVDLLYAMCDKNNAEEIVLEMLTYLETADYSIKEEMVNNLCCYVDTQISYTQFGNSYSKLYSQIQIKYTNL